MNNNGNNDKGQEQVVTKGRLRTYVDWLNTTKGGSFLTASVNSNNYLVIEKMSGLGDGTIHWIATTSDARQTTAVTSGSSLQITPKSTTKAPRGKFWFEDNNGVKYTELDNTNGGNNYSGYETMVFNESADSKDDRYCLTYADITGGTYARYFDEAEMADGLIVDGYSIASTGQYSDNQLVVEKDVNFGKFKYDLVVSAITIEVDAMNDLEEYRYGVIPGSNNLPYAVVYDVTNGTETPFKEFDLSGAELTDNPTLSGKTYSGLTIVKGSSVARAPIINGNYSLEVYFYSDSAYTLSSTTVTGSTSTGGSETIGVSNNSFSGTSGNVTVNIASNGQVTFSIKQRKETYGYFPVNVYKQGTSDYSIDENGNVDLSATTKFIKASDYSRIVYSYDEALVTSVGWLSNAGDNFGNSGFTNGKKYLSTADASTYNDELIREGFSESALTEVCGKDVYNIDSTVYNRGEEVGLDSTYRERYHIAYANDVYARFRGDSLNRIGGFSGTTHLFVSEGRLVTDYVPYTCQSGYLDYTFDSFKSEYQYIVKYVRNYYKDVHSYGLTSILRRYRNINGSFVDTSSSYKLVNEYSSSNPSGYIPKATRNIKINGNNFPKHISGRTISWEYDLFWDDVTNKGSNNFYKSGDNFVSGWTTIYEYPTFNERWGSISDTGAAVTGNPTVRDVKYVPNTDYDDGGHIECQANTDTDRYYYNIAPRFYMVDAESCHDAVSGYNYDFTVLSMPITDTYSGTSEDRYYYLDYQGFLGDKVNNQMARKDMITYLNLDNGAVEFDSIRYGSTKQNSMSQTKNEYSINPSCCPSAPTQKVYWIDSYAPNNTYGGKILGSAYGYPPAESTVADRIQLIPIDDDNKMHASESYYLVPTTPNWNNFNNKITINDINNFTDRTNKSFPGETYYSASTNNSSHNLKDSISFACVCGFTESEYGDDSMLGYHVNSGYNDGNPMILVSGTTNYYINGDGDKIYSGMPNGSYEFLYFTPQGNAISTTAYNKNSTNRYVMQFDSNLWGNTGRGESIYKATDALRPCSGDVTMPYWYTTIGFAVRVNEEPSPSFDPITELGLTVDVAYDGSHYTKLTSGGTLFPNTGDNMVYHQLIDDVNDEIRLAREDYTSLRGIYGYLEKDGPVINGDDTYLQKMKLTLLFIDVYPTSDECFDVVVNGPTHEGGQQKLHWRLNGKTSQSVGADIFYDMSDKGWHLYKENNKEGVELSCIGDFNDEYSVIYMINNYRDGGSGTPLLFEDMININENYSKTATDGGNKGIWY